MRLSAMKNKAKTNPILPTPEEGRAEVRSRMSEITCLWQLQLKTDSDIIIEL